MEPATGLIMATVFLFSGQPDYTKLHPAEVIQLMDDGVTILKDLPPPEADRFISRALPGQQDAAELTPNEQRVFELSWGGNAPRHYLAQEAPDLYRRIALADREGYSVSLVATGNDAELTVQVEATRKALVAGAYDEALDAFVGKPTLVNTVCTTSATVKPGRNTVVVWRPPTGPTTPRPAPASASAAGEVPPWAIGRWHVEAGGDATQMDVRANGTVVFSDWPNTPIPAEIGADGAVWLDWIPEGGDERVLVIGRLNPDGTGRGTICEVDDQGGDALWSATRLTPQGEAGLGAPFEQPVKPGATGAAAAHVPAWAIGKWRIQVGGDATEADVRGDGTVVFSDWPDTPIPATIGADGGVWLDWVPEGENDRVLVIGRLKPNGTGRGAVCQLDDKDDDALWSATRLPSLRGAGQKAAPLAPPGEAPPAPSASPSQAPEAPSVGIVLALGTAPSGTGSQTVSAATGTIGAQIEISTVWMEVAVGSPEWTELMEADDKAQFLQQLVDDKRVKVVNQPRLLVLNNQRGEIATAVSVLAVVPPVMAPGAADTPPANRIALTNALCVTPRLLADGSIGMGVETRFERPGWVTGPQGQVIPIVTYQATNSQLVAPEGRGAVMSALSTGAGELDPEGQPLTRGTQTLILLTPRIVNRGALATRPTATALPGEQEAQLATCRNNVKQLCLAAQMYAQEHNGALPAEDWADQLLPYCEGPGAYVCPAVPDLDVAYALNPAVAGLSLADIKRPANLVLFFEADLVEGRPPDNAHEVLTPPRHGEKIVVGLVDGHVEMVDFEELQKLLQRDPFE